MHSSMAPSSLRRLILGVSVGVLGMALSAGPAAANEPSDWLLAEDDANIQVPVAAPSPDDSTGRPNPAPSPSPSPTPSPSTTPAPATVETFGYDVSYPQCGRSLPRATPFTIVGVNGGRVFSTNPCFGPGDDPSQLEWAGEEAELYFNTGNPGPRLSRFWPSGQSEPRACDTRDEPGEDTADCAFVYGWNAAEFAYARDVDAFVELGWVEEDAEHLPGTTTIWLDVEPANSWRRNQELNVAALEGAVAYLASMEVEHIGFYSTPRLWDRITGGTDRFSDHPAWHAGARDRADAERRCLDEAAFTGGELAMVQWVEGRLDRNVRCDAGE